jgi:hypothetical protein
MFSCDNKLIRVKNIRVARRWNHTQRSGHMLDIVVHRNARLSDATILSHVSARDSLTPVEIHRDWERFRSLANNLSSPVSKIDIADEA